MKETLRFLQELPLNNDGDSEQQGLGKMKALEALEGLTIAIDGKRRHHEIYLSDPMRRAAAKLKTVNLYLVRL